MKTLCLVMLATASIPAFGHDPITTKVTWDREISRLVYAKCGSCHRNGGAAFSLTTYEQARPWATAIKEETLERRMPPFGAVKGFGDLSDDGGLSEEQLEIISDWVEGGAPEGDAALVPDKASIPKLSSARQTRIALAFSGNTTLTEGVTLTGIEPTSLHEGSTLKVIAQRPDGSTVPLIWIYQFNPKYLRQYYFRKPLLLPAGTRIVMSAADVGQLTLLSTPKPSPSKLSAPKRTTAKLNTENPRLRSAK